MKYSIQLIGGDLKPRQIASVRSGASLSEVSRRMAAAAFKRFGQNRVARDDGSLCGYFADKASGDAIVCKVVRS
jgi:hypothetical protein